jgi:hypothetical protein
VTGLWCAIYALGSGLGPIVGGMATAQVGLPWAGLWVACVLGACGVAMWCGAAGTAVPLGGEEQGQGAGPSPDPPLLQLNALLMEGLGGEEQGQGAGRAGEAEGGRGQGCAGVAERGRCVDCWRLCCKKRTDDEQRSLMNQKKRGGYGTQEEGMELRQISTQWDGAVPTLADRDGDAAPNVNEAARVHACM